MKITCVFERRQLQIEPRLLAVELGRRGLETQDRSGADLVQAGIAQS